MINRPIGRSQINVTTPTPDQVAEAEKKGRVWSEERWTEWRLNQLYEEHRASEEFFRNNLKNIRSRPLEAFADPTIEYQRKSADQRPPQVSPAPRAPSKANSQKQNSKPCECRKPDCR